jgi:hypothetical protein
MNTQRMIKVSVEVSSGTARFRVSVQAQSIRRALGMVESRYPHGEVRLVFPIEPEGFFVSEPPVSTRATGRQQTNEVAA